MIAHLVTRNDWESARALGAVVPDSLAGEGFVHCSAPHQTLAVAERFYPAYDNLLALIIDDSTLEDTLVWEPPAHPDGSPAVAGEEFFPHLYAPLPVSAVTKTLALQWKGDTYAEVAPLHRFHIVALAEHPEHWEQAARWSYEAWKHEFPNDTEKTYLDQFGLAADPGNRLVEVYAAVSPANQLLGLTTLVDDDELPGVSEPGPWIAAVWVHPSQRTIGVGGSLVRHATLRARALGVAELYLYTENQQAWYERKGWRRLREAALNGLPVTVMTRLLAGAPTIS